MNQSRNQVKRLTRIIANAGSGKTYELSTRYIAIMAGMLDRETPSEPFNPASVLATTFTRAAAGEIRNRILTRLAEAALDAGKKESLLKDVCQVGPALTKPFDPAHILQRLTNQFDRLEIRTIDSMFTRLAHAFGQDVGLSLPLQFLSEAETAEASRQALQRVMRESTDVGVIARRLKNISKGVAVSSVARVIGDALDHGLTVFRDTMEPDAFPGEIPSAWQAPPGTISGHWLDKNQLMKTVEELQSAVAAIDSPHSAYAQMLKKLNPIPSMLKGRGGWQEWNQSGPQSMLAKNPPQLTFFRKPIPNDCAECITKLLQHILALEDMAIQTQTLSWAEFLSLIHEAWKRMMAQNEKVTFESVTRELSQAMTHFEMSEIAFRLDARIDHLLLDEFQDTSVGQWNALRPLVQEIASTDSVERVRSLLVVGDPKQSIYGWRSGEPRLLCELKDMIHDNRTEEGVDDTIQLCTSYRSAPIILQFVDHLFQGLKNGTSAVFGDLTDPAEQQFLAATQQWAAQYTNHRTADHLQNMQGCVQVHMLPYIKESVAQVDRRLVRESAEIAMKQFRRFNGQMKVAIIARRNADVAKLVECIRNHPQAVPCVALAGGDLQTSPAVVAFLDALRFSSHPSDTITLFSVATTPLAPIIGVQSQWACHHLDETCNQQHAQFREQSALKIRLHLARHGVAGTLSQWHRQLLACTQVQLDQSDHQRLARFIQEATRLEEQGDRTVDEIIDSLTCLRVQDPPSNAIHVINIHQAKGLEWDAVVYHAGADRKDSNRPTFAVNRQQPLKPPSCVVPWITSQPLPSRYQPTMDFANIFRLQEQLSQLYVVLTRAKQGLWITAARKQSASGCTPSGIIDHAMDTFPDRSKVESIVAAPSPQVVDTIDQLFEIMSIGEPLWQFSNAKSDAHPTAVQLVPVSLATQSAVKVRAMRSPSFQHKNFSHASSGRGELLATEKGTIAHLVAESIHWSEDWKSDAPQFAQQFIVKARALFANRNESAIAEVVRNSIAQLNAPQIQSLLRKPANDAAVFNERKYIRMFQNGRVQEGIIDRVVLVGTPLHCTHAQIVDYKTDSFPADTHTLEQWLQQRAEHHSMQVNLYAQVIAEEHNIPLENISMHLILLDASTTVQVQLSAVDMQKILPA